MRLLERKILYIQVHQDHFLARVSGGDRTIMRRCHALGNRRHPVTDFEKIRHCLKGLVKELVPGPSLRKPWALLHFIPADYAVTQPELVGFKAVAERSGIGFCFLSKWETPHTDQELAQIFSASAT